MTIVIMLLQKATQKADPLANRAAEWVDSVVAFLDTPLPFSPLTEYLLVILLLWLLARRKPPEPNFDEQAQAILEHKFHQGELTKDSYDKFRQDTSLHPK